MEAPAKSYSVWLWSIGALMLYAILNLFCVSNAFIPGAGMFIFFGILAPITLAITHALWIYRKRAHVKYWRSWSSIGAFFYMASGAVTFSFITQLWASI